MGFVGRLATAYNPKRVNYRYEFRTLDCFFESL
jgi:hypothetical protein